MNTYLDSYAENAARFTDVVETIGAAAWSRPSPCPDWTAAEVVDHVVDSQREFLTRQGISLPDLPAGGPADRWAAHVAATRAAVDEDVAAREYDGYFGRTTIGATLADFYGFDMVAHRWDLARAVGAECAFSEDELDRLELALKGFGDHAYAPGVFGPPVAVPPDASRQDRLLGLMGRDPAA